MSKIGQLLRQANYVGTSSVRFVGGHRKAFAWSSSVFGLSLIAGSFAMHATANVAQSIADGAEQTVTATAAEVQQPVVNEGHAQSNNSDGAKPSINSSDDSQNNSSSVHVSTVSDENGTHTSVSVDGEDVDLPNDGNGSIHETIPTANGSTSLNISAQNSAGGNGRNTSRSSNSLNISSSSRSNDGSTRSSTSTHSSSSSFTYQSN